MPALIQKETYFADVATRCSSLFRAKAKLMSSHYLLRRRVASPMGSVQFCLLDLSQFGILVMLSYVVGVSEDISFTCTRTCIVVLRAWVVCITSGFIIGEIVIW